ncbi:TPA: molecular chaperone [Morganella morganii]|nr:molecular chaperone [Morganella morganii]
MKKYSLFIILSLLTAFHATASVTMMGNRIIYNENSRDKTLVFSNDNDTPSLVQIWTDINNPKSSPDNADGPFVAVPAIFNIADSSKQNVKLTYTGRKLPDDRESVFYFNYLSIPSVKKEDAEKNKLMIVVTNRMKLFYRPAKIGNDAGDVINKLEFRRQGSTLDVRNPTPFYASVSSAALSAGNKQGQIDNTSMIAPFSSAQWALPAGYQSGNVTLILGVINDYGAEKTRSVTLN